jgi:hypothetical protein
MKESSSHRITYLISVIALFFSIEISSQVNYIVRDTIATINIKLIDGGALNNALKCQVQERDRIATYSPFEVAEYGFKDGRVYISREILIKGVSQMVFLERLADENVKLYYFRGKGKKTFFIESEDERFIEVPRHDENIGKNAFREILKNELTEYNIDNRFYNSLGYRRNSMARLLRKSDKYSAIRFRFDGFGILAGVGVLQYNPLEDLFPQELNNLTIKQNTAGLLGMYIEQRLIDTDFSFYTELNYSMAGVSYYQVLNNTASDLVINSSWMSLLLSLRYTIPVRKNYVYVQSGGLFSKVFKHERNIYNAVHTTSAIYTTKTDYSFNSGIHLGLMFSGGFKLNAFSDKKIFLEVRYLKDYISASDPVIKRDGLYLVTGIEF